MYVEGMGKSLSRRVMDISNLKLIAFYNAKLLLRSWLFRLFFLLTFCYVTLNQLATQTTIFSTFGTGLISLPSHYPFVSVYMFMMFQIIPLIFLAGSFLAKEKKMDFRDSIYYRPASNIEHIVGMMLGFGSIFLGAAILCLCIGLIGHSFASLSPVDVWFYPFYLFVIVVPSLVFMLGLSFLIYILVRHRGLAVLVLMVIIAMILFVVSNMAGGLFDPFGVSLPNAFSTVTGHSGLPAYLAQRVCWMLFGLAFAGWAILAFQRLSNSRENRVRVRVFSVACMVAGVVVGGCLVGNRLVGSRARAAFAATYERYADKGKGTIVAHDIDFESAGGRLRATSVMSFYNDSHGILDEVILYLNPALDVLSAKMAGDGASIPVVRDLQVVRIPLTLAPGDSVRLQLEYSGSIDERICYLDVPESAFDEIWTNDYLRSGAGKRFALLDPNFTVLTPECLWYPVANPSFNPVSLHDVVPDFTRYSLRVATPEGLMAVAPGSRIEVPGGTRFVSDSPLPGLSLCLGPLECRRVRVDSTLYELFLIRGHEDILRGLDVLRDTLPSIIRELREGIEYELRARYPHRTLAFVETPITFTSFSRFTRGGSELVQPGMILFPERGIGIWQDYQAGMEMEKKHSVSRGGDWDAVGALGRMLTYSLKNLLTTEARKKYTTAGFVWNFLVLRGNESATVGYFEKFNPFYIRPALYNQVIAFRSDRYPTINTVVLDLLRNGESRNLGVSIFERTDDYFDGHSLEDAFRDRDLSPVEFSRLLRAKSAELAGRIGVNDISTEGVLQFFHEYITEHPFRKIDFEDFNDDFVAKFGVDWNDILPDWYTNNQLSSLWIKDVEVMSFHESDFVNREMERYGSSVGSSGRIITSDDSVCMRFRVYNDSDVDGLISIESHGTDWGDYYAGGGWSRNPREDVGARNFVIPARGGKYLCLLLSGGAKTIRAHISKNIPGAIEIGLTTKEVAEGRSEYIRDVSFAEFLSDSDEIVVDNEDEGFVLVAQPPRERLRDLFIPRKKDKYSVGFPSSTKELGSGYMICREAYGLSKHTYAYLMSGSGARAEWTARVENAGGYDIYAHLPTGMRVREEYVQGNKGNERAAVAFEPPLIKQYYTVVHDENVEEGSIDVGNQTGWLFLGRFRLTGGECKVVLQDKGVPSQILAADAIKWVRVKDE